MDRFGHSTKQEIEPGKKEKFMMFTIMVKHKTEIVFESFDGIDKDIKEAKMKAYINFLMNTKLPLPDDLTKESII